MSEISIWSPINKHDFWLPGVFYTGKEHSLKGSGAMDRQGQGIESSQGIENGSWMGIPTWQWPKTQGQDNKGVAQKHIKVLE